MIAVKTFGGGSCLHSPLLRSGALRITFLFSAILAAAGSCFLWITLSPAQGLTKAFEIFNSSSRCLSNDFNTSIIDQIVHTRIRNDVPEALLKFDWLIYPSAQFIMVKRKPVPKYVFCEATEHGISVLSAELRQLDADYLGDVLLVGGEDTHLSVLEQNIDWKILLLKFKRVRYEAKDIASDVVETFPMGLLPHYSLAAGEDNIRWTVRETSVIKQNFALAAWGKWWPLLDEIPSRKELADFVNKTYWIHHMDVEKDKWWQTLSTYKFMFCPTGAGIQSPKFVEAILCLTVPIVQNDTAYFDLYQQGFPIIVVDTWEELEPRKLEKAWERLLPSLVKTRNLYQTDNWFHYVIADDLKLTPEL